MAMDFHPAKAPAGHSPLDHGRDPARVPSGGNHGEADEPSPRPIRTAPVLYLDWGEEQDARERLARLAAGLGMNDVGTGPSSTSRWPAPSRPTSGTITRAGGVQVAHREREYPCHPP